MATEIMQSVFDLWSEFQSYVIGAPYIYREINRRYNLLGKIRILKEDDPDLPKSLTGKVCIITGGTRGIGAEVVKTLLRKDCHVITGTSAKKQSEIDERREKIMSQMPEGKGKLDILPLDLKSMKSVMEFVAKFKDTKLTLDYFIANAGIMYQDYHVTEDNFESHFAINYLSQCLLIWHLMPILADTAKANNTESRIVIVSSALHGATVMKFTDLQSKALYSPYHAYAQSKLAQVMFSYQLNRWLLKKSLWNDLIKVHSLHPGIVNTDLLNRLDWIKAFPQLRKVNIFRTPKEGSETIIYAALSSELNGIGGKYLEDNAQSVSSAASYYKEDQEKLWKITWSLLSKWKSDVFQFESNDLSFTSIYN